MRQRGPLFISGGDVNWCNLGGISVAVSELESPCHLTLILLDIENGCYVLPQGASTPVSIIALFTRARRWSQPR